MNFLNFYKSEIYQKLLIPGHPANPIRNRADSFLKVFELLCSNSSNKDYFLVETGCMRADHGTIAFGDDGASTFIFDKFIQTVKGKFYSVDISQNNVDHAKKFVSEKTKIFCSDSVKFLWNIPQEIKIDFLYLDSYDIEKHNPHPSQLHHLKELCAATKNLKSGSIILVDDHDAFFTQGKIGKGTYVKEFMESIGAEKLFEGYQIGWIIK